MTRTPCFIACASTRRRWIRRLALSWDEVGQDSYDAETWASSWPDGTRMTRCTEADLDKLVQKKVRALAPADILAKIEEVLHESWCADAEEDAPITAEERLGMILGFALKALQEERLLVPQPGAFSPSGSQAQA